MSKLHISSSLSLPKEAVTQTFAILAKRGVGKTYTASVLAEEMLKAPHQTPIGSTTTTCSDACAPRRMASTKGWRSSLMGGEHGDVPRESDEENLGAWLFFPKGRLTLAENLQKERAPDDQLIIARLSR